MEPFRMLFNRKEWETGNPETGNTTRQIVAIDDFRYTGC